MPNKYTPKSERFLTVCSLPLSHHISNRVGCLSNHRVNGFSPFMYPISAFRTALLSVFHRGVLGYWGKFWWIRKNQKKGGVFFTSFRVSAKYMALRNAWSISIFDRYGLVSSATNKKKNSSDQRVLYTTWVPKCCRFEEPIRWATKMELKLRQHPLSDCFYNWVLALRGQF